MSDEFIYCPRCGSKDISETDYEIPDEDNEGEFVEDEGGRHCDDCHWEGDQDQLVCKT